MLLLRTQMNAVHRILVGEGLDPSEFEWRTQDSGRVSYPGKISVLVHKQSDYFYRFITDNRGHFNSEYSPGRAQLLESTDAWVPWDLCFAPFKAWLEYLVREVEAPSLWDDVLRRVQAQPFLGSPEPEGNTPFTAAEVEFLREEIEALRVRVNAVQELNDAQAAKLEEGLVYMRDALGRLGRYDWRHVAATALITKGAELGIPAVGKLLLRFALHLVGSPGSEVHVLPPGEMV